MSDCDDEKSRNGLCCCNCRYQIEIRKHPWNEGDAKGSIMSRMGWACANPIDGKHGVAIFFSSGHGMCEIHEEKNA